MNHYCPITYEPIEEDQKYSSRGLKSLSPRLLTLKDFPYSAEEQRQHAKKHATKLSIQGVQPKLSVILNVTDACFEMTEIGGTYILKPQNDLYAELPENEDLTMRLAKTIGIEVPLHGLIYCADGSLTYFIKRFDRSGRKNRIPVEDFSQLAGEKRDTKYNSSMEKLVSIIENFCTFPAIEKKNLLVRTLFNYIIGNEDMHLKNFSTIIREGIVELAPAYDFVNSTLALPNATEEIALPLKGKKRNLKRSDLIQYYGQERLGLNDKVISEILNQFRMAFSSWDAWINKSFLSEKAKDQYLKLVESRINILNI